MHFKLRRRSWCKHLNIHYSLKVDHRPKSDKRMPNRKYNNHHPRKNNRQKLEEGGIQRVTVDGRHVEPNPPVIDIDYRINMYQYPCNEIEVNDDVIHIEIFPSLFDIIWLKNLT